MPDYKKMYKLLFEEMTKAIFALQKAQQQTEELYISGGGVHGLEVPGRFPEVCGDSPGKQPPRK